MILPGSTRHSSHSATHVHIEEVALRLDDGGNLGQDREARSPVGRGPGIRTSTFRLSSPPSHMHTTTRSLWAKPRLNVGHLEPTNDALHAMARLTHGTGRSTTWAETGIWDQVSLLSETQY